MKVATEQHDKAGTHRHVPKNESHRMELSHHQQMPPAVLQLLAKKVLVNQTLRNHAKALPSNVSNLFKEKEGNCIQFIMHEGNEFVRY